MSWLNVRDRNTYLRLVAVLFTVFLAVGLTSPLLANYVKAIGATTSDLGIVLASYQIASLGSQFWWGQRSDRLGRRKPLVLIGTAGLMLAYLGTASVNYYLWLIPLRVFEGVAFAAYQTGSLALIGDVLEDEAARGRLMGTYRSLGSLAFSIAALTGGWLADMYSLRVPILLAAGCFGLAFLLISGVRERGDQARPVRPSEPARPAPSQAEAPPPAPAPVPLEQQPVLLRAVLWPFLALTFAWSFGMGSVVSLWPVFMSSKGYSQTQISGLWALAALGEVGCLLLAGYLADRLGRKWVIITGVSLMACIYTAYTLAPAFAWFVPIQIVRSFAYSCFEAPALLYATELGLRQRRGRLAGLYYSAGGLGGVAGSLIGATAAQALGYPTMYRTVALGMVVIAAVVAIVMPRLRSARPVAEVQPGSTRKRPA
jgi:MFS family permease